MKSTLIGIAVAVTGLAALAQQALSPLERERVDVKPELDYSPPLDPRAAQLRSGPGGVPAGSAIAKLAKTDPVFAQGLALFDRRLHVSEGLGSPEMNADSCRACHSDPAIGGAGPLELNVSRFGDDGGNGGPFQNLPGGQGLSKLYPSWLPGREEYDPNTATVFEQRQTPSLFGGGLIESIPDAVILAGEDPADADGDGVFGVARMVVLQGVPEVGRFGWKAQIPTLRDFVKDAMGAEMGITTAADGRGFALVSDADGVADPEFSEAEVDTMVHFLSLLPRPERSLDEQVVGGPQGGALFASVGCATCHVPSLQGADGPVPLYSNLLLHDVMPANYRGMSEPGAGVGMFRTPPLWGVGKTAPYMHDGRASTLRAAILAHDSEAAGARARFVALPAAKQTALIDFLETL